MIGKTVLIQPRLNEHIKRLCSRHDAHYAILLIHRELLWL